MRFLILPLTIIAQQLYSNHTVSYKGDSGFDLFIVEDQIIKAKETGFVRTGIKIAAYSDDNEPTSYTVVGRSSISKSPLRLAVPAGIVDAGFRGELRIPLDNIRDFDFELKVGQRYFSLAGYDGKPVTYTLVDQLDETERGEKGLGSTNELSATRKTSLNPIVPLSINKTRIFEPLKKVEPLVLRTNNSTGSQNPSNLLVFPQATSVEVINIIASEAQTLISNLIGSKTLRKATTTRTIAGKLEPTRESKDLRAEVDVGSKNSTKLEGK
ncbi:uncharacterized protein cubi_01242 [Cryptosporidium ubiquitum]|uniref:Deoxyuridine 5'-triphosphate nucleotidohydrolase n=1 Tax=Cryptosporidium ubiquitum TaxID=857276 RepID=A0A1J4MJL7_9CRYT|nr:uncharacterized protein cubi_01242 [Cryptosporidium ubiquitum]OII74398.1 hypothetical protein cubi_01242 [Cryptosporidium ubiquitum]